jgi:hypothetical protein
VAIEHREELAAATAVVTHPSVTIARLNWHRERPSSVMAVEASGRRYFDSNQGAALTGFAVRRVLSREPWSVWAGVAAAARDTDRSSFRVTATSSTFSGGLFVYSYRGEYDPYWSPEELLEARAVAAVEHVTSRTRFKLYGDFGVARDYGRAFGPDAGLSPIPAPVYDVRFRRRYHPGRAGATGTFAFTPRYSLEMGVERQVTVDYRANTFHVSLVRRR